MAAGPPAYAWDWFARQRLLWRRARARLADAPHTVALRYREVAARGDVMPLLRTDYPREPIVRQTVNEVVGELAFLGRCDRPFASLGIANPPRGLRWWWTALTGEQLESGTVRKPAASGPRHTVAGQMTLDDVFEGYGDG